MHPLPETRYAKSGDVHIAYQVMGEGPIDLVFNTGFVSHLELQLEDSRPLKMFARLASFCRLIRFDKRGVGLSDRLVATPTLEERMDDLRAVLDAVGSEKAVHVGSSEGGPMSILFAATYPERVTSLILYGTMACMRWAPDNPWGRTDADCEARLKLIEDKWGQGASVGVFAPSLANNEEYRTWLGRTERSGSTPGGAQALLRLNHDIDVRHVLPAITQPTLVLHRSGDKPIDVGHGRYLAGHIKGAQYVELPGDDHSPWAGDVDALCDEIQIFLTGAAGRIDTGSVFSTLMFTDIVDATQHAVDIGDRAWTDLLTQHHAVARQEIERHRGREIDNAGDGFFAAFDGPARAVSCARSIAEAVKELGIEIRAGVHTGECMVMGNKLSGIAVHIGARVAARAAPGEVLVSSTVRDLVAGSGLAFDSRGAHILKGVPGEWQLYAVA